jgi:hypothetical protein
MKKTLKKAFLFTVVVLPVVMALFIGGCTTEDTDTPPSDEMEIRPAPIHEVHVNIAESFPPQIFIYIQGGLSDGCTTFHELKTERTGNTINIEVTVQRPKDMQCTQVYGYFEKNVALGTDFISGETYIINVNDYSTSFKMQ